MVSATFRICSATLTPDVITAQLGVQPSKCFEKGSLMSPRNPASAKRDAALWMLDSTRTNASAEECLSDLADFVNRNNDALQRLSGECDFDIFCAFEPCEGERMLILTSPLLRKFGVVPIDLVVNFFPANE